MVNLFQQLPLGRSDFPALLDSNAIYVDKTEMVCRLAENDDKLFFSPEALRQIAFGLDF